MTKTATCLMALITGLALTAPAFAQDATEIPAAPAAEDDADSTAEGATDDMTEETGEDTAEETSEETAEETSEDATDAEGSGFEGATENPGKDGSELGLDVDAAALFQTTTCMTYVELLSTLSTVKDDRMAMDALDDMSAGGEVYLVQLSELQGEGGENTSSVMQMVNDRQATMADLHAHVAANATVRTALQDNDLLPGNVVAIHGIGEGRLIVVVDDRPI